MDDISKYKLVIAPLQYLMTPELEKHIHKLIKKITSDIDSMKFNTAIATLMALINDIYKKKAITKAELNELLEKSDVVSIHAPSIPATKHMINAETLKLMKRKIHSNISRVWKMN